MARPRLGHFLSSFVEPLIKGGALHVGAPISLTDLETWDGELAHASTEQVAVDDARMAVLSTLVARPPELMLDDDDLALAAAVHNALFLLHPDARSFPVTISQRRRVLGVGLELASRPLSRHRTRVLGRHALLHNLPDLVRKDVTVSWWTGKASFYGQTPPSRLTAWRGARRVREDVHRVDADELLAAPEVAPIIATLIRRTPLTLMMWKRPAGPFLHWEDAAFLLRDPELARAVTYEALRPTEPAEQLAIPARLAAAFEQMIEGSPEPREVRAVAAFLSYLAALFALGEDNLREANAKSPLITASLGVERAGERPRGVAAFWALPNALLQVEPALAIPPGLLDVPQVAQRWRAHRTQVESMVGAVVIDVLVQRLRRHLESAAVAAAP